MNNSVLLQVMVFDVVSKHMSTIRDYCNIILKQANVCACYSKSQ